MPAPLKGKQPSGASSSSSSSPPPPPAPAMTTPMKPSDVATSLRAALASVSGSTARVHARDHSGFQLNVIIFNGAVKSPAVVLVQPGDARDVATVVRFCRQHHLELSVKGGGFGTHGWSVAGHVILDLSSMADISLSLPASAETLQTSFETMSLRPVRPSYDPEPPKRGLPDGFAADGDGSDGDGADADGTRGKRRLASSVSADGTPESSRSPTADSDGDSIMRLVSPADARQAAVAMSCGGGRSATHGTNGNSGSNGAGYGDQDNLSASLLSDGIFRMQYPTSPASSSSAPTRPRVTYVNPSPSASAHSSSFSSADGIYNPSSLVLNTNPDPPPYIVVSFGTGADSKKLDKVTAASPYGAFHIPTSSFPVGSGQFLTGGFGFLGRRYGLAMDNVVEAEVVLADGRIVWVGENGAHGGEWRAGEDPAELWWALRGAGPVFGVATRLRVKAYYVPSVYAGNFIYLFDRETTPSLLRHVRDCIKGAPKTFYINIIITAGPANAPAIVVMQICHQGSRAEGETYTQAISSWEGGARCLFQDFSERTFERQQLAVEDVLKGGQGRKWYIKSDMLTSLSDEVIDQTCERFDLVPDGCTWLFEFTGGSVMAGVTDTCYPTSHREANFTVAALHQWGHNEPADEDMRCVMTAAEWIRDVVHPNSPGGPLPCFLQSSLEADVRGVYGANFDRLAALKRRLDPTNFFRHAMWPRPGAPGPERQYGSDAPRQQTVKTLADGFLDEDELEREVEGAGAMDEAMGAGAMDEAMDAVGATDGLDGQA